MDRKKALRQLKLLQKQSGTPRLAAEGWDEEWQTLVSIILSARTRDEVTIVICGKLFKKYKTISSLSKASLKDIESIIRPVNFYRNKSKNLSACAKMLVKDFKGSVPHTIDELVTLPGVGRKTANVFLSEQGKDAIGVDTHVSYISQKLGWTKNKDAHKIEMDLKTLFPKAKWSDVNLICVHFGKTHMSRRKKDELLAKIAK